MTIMQTCNCCINFLFYMVETLRKHQHVTTPHESTMPKKLKELG